jgi:myo-inositol 2-dehydrogenase/D-chiro-inositol 1-dehydrogenase
MNIRVGVIGVGNIGTAHATNLAKAVSGSSVSVLYDFDQKRAQELAIELGAKAVATFQEVIVSPEVDAILIASPDKFHKEQVIAAMKSGKPILCEKPLTVTEADAEEILAAEVSLGKRLVQMGFMRRFDPGYIQLKSEFNDDGIGAPLIIHNIHRNTFAAYGLNTEGTLTNSVVHEFDINRWLLDEEIKSISVMAGKASPLTPDGQKDPVLVIMESESGVLITVEAFMNDQYGYEVSCSVSGVKGSTDLGEGSFVTSSKKFSRGSEIPELWLTRFNEAYRIQLQAWINSIREGKLPVGSSIWDGYAATVLANKAVEAYRTGKKVEITLKAKPGIYS